MSTKSAKSAKSAKSTISIRVSNSSGAIHAEPRRSSVTSVKSLIDAFTWKHSSESLPHINGISQITLNGLNEPQDFEGNQENLDLLGGVEGLAKRLGVDIEKGLTHSQVNLLGETFGKNKFTSPPKKYFILMFLESLTDPTLVVLMVAAIVSLAIGIFQDGQNGWIEGAAIFIAIMLVSMITTSNDYSKELQFRALERSSQHDEKTTVVRDGGAMLIPTRDLVVGDIVKLQPGDMVPADCILVNQVTCSCNESALTGEPEDVRKGHAAGLFSDIFLLSSCLVTESSGDVRAMVTGISLNSQWGKIHSSLVEEPVNTPLQDKLEHMSALIGYIGVGFAFATFIALIINIWVHDLPVVQGVINAFILAVTIVVVAIPEGLPLAVAISLAYSTKKMYRDRCFVRVLAACETMGNATNICSDKTGTLTQNCMTVVQAWFSETHLGLGNFVHAFEALPHTSRNLIIENAAVNRTAYYINRKSIHSSNMKIDANTDSQHDRAALTAAEPQDPRVKRSFRELTSTVGAGTGPGSQEAVVGSKTEASLMDMISQMGLDPDVVQRIHFNEDRDRLFPFDSVRKSSTAIVQRRDGSMRMYCKGASECVLRACTQMMDKEGNKVELTDSRRQAAQQIIDSMASQALRTLVLAHKDFPGPEVLPDNWRDEPSCDGQLCLDGIVGITDPIRDDVVEAVKQAQQAGVVVRMITGDGAATASAIARQCGILGKDDICIEGPTFRTLTPQQLDDMLPRLRVIARASPEDKRLLVVRLNGNRLPETKEAWLAAHVGCRDVSWENDKDLLLPGYKQEWAARRHGVGGGVDGDGDVVGVTGDGTNDAPALKAADVGLAMGLTGTRVAQEASSIVILDDRFSSIVNAIRWGRCVYDNIRKFLQFQLTVNIVALVLVFVGAVAGLGTPLNAVMMLWVNLIMDTFGALALGTELPSPALLKRMPYRRSASLISWPMWRNIAVMGAFQLTLLFTLLFSGAELFGVYPINTCVLFTLQASTTPVWSIVSRSKIDSSTLSWGTVDCATFNAYCIVPTKQCYEANQAYYHGSTAYSNTSFSFSSLDGYKETCLDQCSQMDYTLNTIIFNTFIYCQIFNEYVSRKFEEVNMFQDIETSPMFLLVSLITIVLQALLVQYGGSFVKTTPLTSTQWLVTIALGAITLPFGVVMRYIPIKEDPNSFFVSVLVDPVEMAVQCKPRMRAQKRSDGGENASKSNSQCYACSESQPTTPRNDENLKQSGNTEYDALPV